MESTETLISCNRLGKIFCRDLKRSLWYGVKDSASDLFRIGERPDLPPLRKGEFWANKDVNFEVKRGECLGIIGRNGAGKTTLLKILNGLIKPDAGFVDMQGRVGALIALGAGFNPILTGRENLFVNASILGLSKREIDGLIDEILEFSEIGEAIDSPVRTYSSGMSVRLGFAIATCLRPDILIIDEVLAVGDADFRLKCLKRMRDVLNTGCAVLLVSHNTTDIRNMADRVLWLKDGETEAYGTAAEVVTQYLGTSHSDDAVIEWMDESTAPGGKTVTLKRLSVLPPESSDHIAISTGAEVSFTFDCRKSQINLGFTLEVRTEEQIIVFHTGGPIASGDDATAGTYVVDVTLPPFLLNSGKYQVTLTIDESQSIPLAKVMNAVTFEVRNEALGVNHSQLPGVVAPRLQWTHEILPATGRTARI